MHRFRRLVAFVVLVFVLVPSLAFAQIGQPRLLVDMSSGEVLMAENAGRPWHPASLTKLMTALLAFDAIASGRVTLETPVISSANALSAPPSRMGFPVDTAISLRDALYILIVKSANDTAIAVAETIGGDEATFVAMMNSRAAQLGLTGTHFVNPHGLHDPRQVTTARDIAVLAMTIRLLYPQYDPIFATHAISHAGAIEESNNNLLTGFSGTDGMKTGYVCASGLNMVVTAERGGRALLAVVLGGASSRDRGETAGQMLTSGFGGGYRGLGYTLAGLPNQPELAPVDMRPLICGPEARTYAESREAAFPAGLAGHVSYLNAEIAGATHAVVPLGRVRDVALPRPRPDWLPVLVAGGEAPSGAPVAMGAAAPAGLVPFVPQIAAPSGAPTPPRRPAWL